MLYNVIYNAVYLHVCVIGIRDNNVNKIKMNIYY